MGLDLAEQISTLEAGGHLCLFYDKDPAEQFHALVPFIRDGLDRDEQFIYIADDQTVDELAGHLQRHDIDIAGETRSGRLRLCTRKEWRQAGELDPEKKAQQVRQFVADAAKDGFRGIRFAVEMTWTLGPDIDPRVLELWEASINTLFSPAFPARIICQYNRQRLSPALLLAALHTHPVAIVGQEVYPNVFYKAPLLLNGNGHAAGNGHEHGHQNGNGHDSHQPVADQVEWMLSQLKQARTGEKQREEQIAQQAEFAAQERAQQSLAETNRKLAEQVDALTRLHQLTMQLADAPDTGAMMQLVLEHVARLHGTDRGFLSLYDQHNDRLCPCASLRFQPEEAAKLACVPPGTGACGTAFAERRRVVVEDTETDPLFEEHRADARRLGFRAVHSTPLLARDGRALGVLSVHFAAPRRPATLEIQIADMIARQAADFIERSQAQEALVSGERRNDEIQRHFAAIVESSDDAILSKDLNGVIRSWNQGAESIFGYRAEEVLGKHITILMPPERENEEPAILGRIRRGERIDHYETIRRRKDGTLVDISLTVSPIKDASGNVVGASKIARDISLRKRAHEELRATKDQLAQLNQELEERVRARTASLTEALAQMEEFSYTVSHDLRAPARAMKSYAQIVLEDFGQNLEPQARDYLERIIRGGTRMDSLVQDVLTYSSLSRRQLQLQPIRLDKVVSDVIEQYPQLQPPRCEMTVRAPLLPVCAHESSLAQAISNLLLNAAKFMPPGEHPQITVRTEARGANVRLWVEDNGIGIKREYQHRIFGIFERLPSAVPYEGTGIGLAIVRKAVEKMGGAVGLESDGLTGSRFWIELPPA